MGVVSFKISRTGSRFNPKPQPRDSAAEPGSGDGEVVVVAKNESATTHPKIDWRDEDAAGFSGSSLSSKRHNLPSEAEVSFALNLYPDGYSITKPKENENGSHVLLQDDAKLLFPYDRSSESLLSAIESGHLPGDLLDDIPCNYIDGGVVCEVRDYRKCSPESGSGVHTLHGSPITAKLHLKLSLENIVKDIPQIADDSWTYGDLMEVESRILKVLQPKLFLDPTPRLDRLSDSEASSKIDFDLRGMRKKRLRQLSETVVTTNKLYSKRICMDRIPETSGYQIGEPGSVSGDVTLQHGQDRTPAQDIISNDMLSSRSRSFMQDGVASNLASQQSKLHVGVGAGNQIVVQDPLTGAISTSGSNPSIQDVLSYNGNLNSTGLHGKLETQDGQQRQLSNANKRAMMGADGAQQRFEYMDNLQQGPDMQWRKSLLQQQANARGIQYVNNGGQRQSHLVREGAQSQDIATSVAMGQLGLRTSANGEHNGMAFDNSEVGRIKNDMHMLDSEGMDRLQQRTQPNSFVRPGFTPGWNNISQQVEKKEEQLQKRKTVRSPRVSAGSLAQSPLSARPTEMLGVAFNNHAAIHSAAPPVLSQREKSGVTSIASIPRTQSVTSSANDSMQQQQVQTTGKRRSISLPKTPAMSGVGSPASVSNASIPMNAASPSVGTPQFADHIVLDKFSKIEMVTMRHQLNRRKTKADELSRKPRIFYPQHVSACLSSLETNENIKDDSVKSLSKSVVGGSANSYKIRVLSFVQAEHTSQAPVISRGRTRMIMSEKPNEGTIAMHYGDVDNEDYLRAEDYLPTLPNSHSADLLAAQFQILMIRDGYMMECDIIQTRPPDIPSNSQPTAPATPSTNSAADMQPFSETFSGLQQSEVTNSAMGTNLVANSPMNPLPSPTMLPPGNQLAHQISQGLLATGSIPTGQQHLDSQALRQQQLPAQNQHPLAQHPHIQRSLMMPPASISQLNAYGQNPSLQVGNNQMMGKPPTQLLQQQSHMQQPQMQRKMMMGGVGSAIGSGMVGLGGLNSVVGTGAARAMGGTGIPASISNMPGIGNLGQNSFASSQAIHPGMFSPQQAHAIMAHRIKMSNKQGMLPGTQSLVGGMPGTRQIHPGAPGLSILGNRGSMNPLQRTALAAMSAPKLMAGAGQTSPQQFSQQQQQLLQQQQHQQLLQQQQQQMPLQQQQQLSQQSQQSQQQQEISPLQAAVSPPQVSSPSNMVIPQALSQQLVQQASPQISSGAMHPLSGGNVDPGPASPQLSSQTLGSVGSVTNSPLDLQGVNKSNSQSKT